MHLKNIPTPPDEIPSTMENAYDVFLETWFNDRETVPGFVRLAFFSGAQHMKNLVSQAKTMNPIQVQEFIRGLYKEVAGTLEGYLLAAQQAAAAPSEEEPSPGMNLEPPAPQPESLIQEEPPPQSLIQEEPAPAPKPAPTDLPPAAPNAPQEVGAPQPMMWTMSMVKEFELAAAGARSAQQKIFAFRGRQFRTADAAAIVNHLKNIFANG